LSGTKCSSIPRLSALSRTRVVTWMGASPAQARTALHHKRHAPWTRISATQVRPSILNPPAESSGS
jgi:hypothetical protein